MKDSNMAVSAETIRDIFAKNVYMLRVTEGESKKSLADKLNISRKLYTAIENGETYPDLFVICQVANEFNVGFETLLGKNLYAACNEAIHGSVDGGRQIKL